MSNESGVSNVRLSGVTINAYDSWENTQVVRFTPTRNYPSASFLIGFVDAVITGNTNPKGFAIKEIKLEEGEGLSPWVEDSAVRFWAGASYEDRNNAPFRVLENGKIIATEGEFGGTFTGELSIKTNNNAKEVIRLTDNSAKFDVDVTIGNVLKASVQTKEIDFGDGVYLDLVKGQNSLAIGKNDSTTYNVYDLATTSGGNHKLMSKNGYGGLSFLASGTQVTAGSETPYDYKFARASSSEAVNVVIKGNLVVDNKITMADNNKIELVSISGSNSGIDFMIR